MKELTSLGKKVECLLLLNFLAVKCPECTKRPEFIGLPVEEIRKNYHITSELPSDISNITVLETRLSEATLSFEIESGICINAYLFSDF